MCPSVRVSILKTSRFSLIVPCNCVVVVVMSNAYKIIWRRVVILLSDQHKVLLFFVSWN